MKNLKRALGTCFSDVIFVALALSFAANFLALDYILLSSSTSFRIMATQNTALFNWTALGLALTTAILFGISLAMLIYIFRTRQSGGESAPGTLVGTIVAAVASGCPVCGAWLLPLLGIAGSLAVFPFQGLELRALAILLLGFSILRSAAVINGVCITQTAFRRFAPGMAVAVLGGAVVFALPYVPERYKMTFQREGVSAPTVTQLAFVRKLDTLPEQVNPAKGYEIPVSYGNIGYRLIEAGVIDREKFLAVYERAGTPLSAAQKKVFSAEGLDEPITITHDNAYFLLNLFWAVGLANENPILTEGQIHTYGSGRIGDFASTGGWSIATKPLEEIFAATRLAPLSQEQQARLQKVAAGTFRPCCGNSTAFPDCNHGMALLGVLEMLAATDASEDELFRAAKYFSAFWFPSQAVDVATFFLATEKKSFADIEPRKFVSAQFFSGPGWSQVKGWLDANLGKTNDTPQSGGGCGV